MQQPHKPSRHHQYTRKTATPPSPYKETPFTPIRDMIVERIVFSTELDPFLSLKALASYSGLSVRKLRAFLVDPLHPLPSYRVGGKILVRRSEFDVWMTGYRQGASIDVGGIVAEVLREMS